MRDDRHRPGRPRPARAGPASPPRAGTRSASGSATRSSPKWKTPHPGPGRPAGAFAAEATLARARGEITVAADDLLRDLLSDLIHASGLYRRAGTNLNQAVARLHATGQTSAALGLYAEETIRRGRHLDAVAEQIRNALP